MSRAPIWSGMQKFPNAPMSSGVIAKKIMIRPCIVKMLWYVAGVIAWALLFGAVRRAFSVFYDCGDANDLKAATGILRSSQVPGL